MVFRFVINLVELVYFDIFYINMSQNDQNRIFIETLKTHYDHHDSFEHSIYQNTLISIR